MMKKRMLHYFWMGAGIYVAFCLLLYLGQRKMIYLPSPQCYDLPDGFKEWTAADGHLLGYHRSAHHTNALFFLHGNAGNARGWAQATVAFPGDVFVVEYPGYGDRTGAPSEASLKGAALEAFDHLPAYTRIVVCGQSLGTGVAEVLMRQRAGKIHLLLLITPFVSLYDMARAQMPFIPTGLLLKDRMPVYDAWLEYPGRSWVLLAEHDEVIPQAQSQRFIDRAGPERRVTVVPNTTHNEFRLERSEWDKFLAF